VFRKYFPAKSAEYLKFILDNVLSTRRRLTIGPLTTAETGKGTDGLTFNEPGAPIMLAPIGEYESITSLAGKILHELTHHHCTLIVSLDIS
jgi:hypothetical protein